MVKDLKFEGNYSHERVYCGHWTETVDSSFKFQDQKSQTPHIIDMWILHSFYHYLFFKDLFIIDPQNACMALLKLPIFHIISWGEFHSLIVFEKELHILGSILRDGCANLSDNVLYDISCFVLERWLHPTVTYI